MNDEYHDAYHYANEAMRNKNDRILQEFISRLNEKDRGTLRDRMADAYVSAMLKLKKAE